MATSKVSIICPYCCARNVVNGEFFTCVCTRVMEVIEDRDGFVIDVKQVSDEELKKAREDDIHDDNHHGYIEDYFDDIFMNVNDNDRDNFLRQSLRQSLRRSIVEKRESLRVTDNFWQRLAIAFSLDSLVQLWNRLFKSSVLDETDQDNYSIDGYHYDDSNEPVRISH